MGAPPPLKRADGPRVDSLRQAQTVLPTSPLTTCPHYRSTLLTSQLVRMEGGCQMHRAGGATEADRSSQCWAGVPNMQ